MELSALEALNTIQRELAKRSAELVPDGWKTAEQFAAESGRGIRQVERTLLAAARTGIMERRQYVISLGDVCRRVWHYRVKA